MFPTDRLYEALGTPCSFTQQGAAEAVSIRAVLDARPADVLGGEQISTRYEIRCPAGPVGGLVRRGARFALAGNTYEATASSQPILDGAELVTPVRLVA